MFSLWYSRNEHHKRERKGGRPRNILLKWYQHQKKPNIFSLFGLQKKKVPGIPTHRKAKHITENDEAPVRKVWRPPVSVYFGYSVSVTSHYWSRSSAEIISHAYEPCQIYIWDTEFDVLSAPLINHLEHFILKKQKKNHPQLILEQKSRMLRRDTPNKSALIRRCQVHYSLRRSVSLLSSAVSIPRMITPRLMFHHHFGAGPSLTKQPLQTAGPRGPLIHVTLGGTHDSGSPWQHVDALSLSFVWIIDSSFCPVILTPAFRNGD